ncbi:PREDICTED: uncharacterized GPI-anchored protein At1g61900-like [Lupinus angustifolius]|uniref:uncharacterized GPI-anchored protein At1g61900-like n=1 Tax=Lupinus angustifolius TaxID=3871 RepID=UPI00092F8254|nr:PREDICTED: uncharacterized GPI-anchored protein At1g61900-like [Lupinus angustifolius]
MKLNVFLFLFHLNYFSFSHCVHGSHSGSLDYVRRPVLKDNHVDPMFPELSPIGSPQPFLPLLAPSPLAPFTNTSIPKLSGLCTLNFSAAESLISVTAIDCWDAFAPFLANVICCPQLEATLTILIGQSSKYTDVLALNGSTAKHCFSDVEQILMGQGANVGLQQICSIRSTNLTEASCPVKSVNEFHDIVDTAKLLTACENIDPVKECCYQICQSAILEAATAIASKGSDLLDTGVQHVLPKDSIRVSDCRNIVLRWVASKLDPSHAKKVLRGLSNCKINKACPLVFPEMSHVAKGCGNGISNKSACCNAMESYVSHLQKQSFITNLQALDCADTLAMKLKRSNITEDVYGLCHISLKDFSLQVGNQVAGCLLPSLPSDATFDSTSGISFLCDLNDNIPAPWPSTSQVGTSSCKKPVNFPALPAAASSQSCLYSRNVLFFMLIALSFLLMILL